MDVHLKDDVSKKCCRAEGKKIDDIEQLGKAQPQVENESMQVG